MRVPRRGGPRRGARRVRPGEERRRRLPKVVDRLGGRLALERRLDALDVDRVRVRERVEHVERAHGSVAVCAVAKHEVDPGVQVRAHVLRLERLAVAQHKEPRVPVRPRRELHVVDRGARLRAAEVELVRIAEHLGQVEELGHQLADVAAAQRTGRVPGTRDGAEHAVCQVEGAALQLHKHLCVGQQAHQEVAHARRGRVVRAVVERRHVHLLQLLVPLRELGGALRRLCTHRAVQLPEGVRRVEVQRAARVLGEHPGEHGELREVVHRAPRERVEQHEVVRVGRAPLEPRLRLAPVGTRPAQHARQAGRRRLPEPLGERLGGARGRRRLLPDHRVEPVRQLRAGQHQQAAVPVGEEQLQRRAPVEPSAPETRAQRRPAPAARACLAVQRGDQV